MEDEKIIELFFARSETAIKELDSKYGKVCYSISYNILNNNLDAEECVNDAYLGIWNAIPPQRPNPLLAFVCKIVRNISIMRHRTNTAMKRNSTYDVSMNEIEECIAAFDDVEKAIEAKTLAQMIESFLDTLTVENRVIFIRRYWFSDTYAQIAEHVGMTEKNVSVRLTRVRKQMRKYFTEREGLV